jgi:4-amino-4-deoxy-L-arabinose transferase-like glycosyltransferase
MIHVIEFIPIVLAIIAVVMLSQNFKTHRRFRDRAISFFGALAASLLIVAQLSWWSTFVLKNELFETWYVNYLWTTFNTIAMFTLILVALPRKHNDQNNS